MKPVNLFFACDDNYVPFLAVTLTSIKENCDPERSYAVRVLETGLLEENQQKLARILSEDNFSLEFVNITEAVDSISNQLHTRDYYSKSTYYRLFIPELFPELDKALYLDCDVVLLGDVSKLYDVELGNNLVGAVPDSMVTSIEPFKLYVEKRLRVDAENYFNAGVLLMNLQAMRECGFAEIFLKLLQSVTFQVAQDQDYLNVICQDRVRYLGCEWNTMPGAVRAEDPRLIHYNLDSKPWHRDDVVYGDLFWEYAQRSGFYSEIRQIREDYTEEMIARSAQETVNLIALGHRQAKKRTQNMRIHRKIKRVVNF